MRYNILMFMVMTTLVANGVYASLSPQSNDSLQLNPQPVNERVAVLESDYKHVREAIKSLQEEFRLEIREIKEILREQNDQTERWIVYILGFLVMGDRGWGIFQRVRNNKKGEKS